MDTEQLIEEVRKREYLWDKKYKSTHKQHRKICDELWTEVATICKIKKETAKCKWRSLRDTFLKRLKSVPIYTADANYFMDETGKPNWPHFNSLMFLLKIYKPEQAIVNIKPENIIDINSSYSEESSCLEIMPTIEETITVEDDTISNLKETETREELGREETTNNGQQNRMPFADFGPPLVMIRPQMASSSFTSIKKIYRLEKGDDSVLPIASDEQFKCPAKKGAYEPRRDSSGEMKILEEPTSNDEENLSFFRSILPFMNKLNTVQQLRLRMRFQQIILDEMSQ